MVFFQVCALLFYSSVYIIVSFTNTSQPPQHPNLHKHKSQNVALHQHHLQAHIISVHLCQVQFMVWLCQFEFMGELIWTQLNEEGYSLTECLWGEHGIE